MDHSRLPLRDGESHLLAIFLAKVDWLCHLFVPTTSVDGEIASHATLEPGCSLLKLSALCTDADFHLIDHHRKSGVTTQRYRDVDQSGGMFNRFLCD